MENIINYLILIFFFRYVAQCTVGELVKSVNNHNDKEYSNESLLVFGNGDGGGGPLSSMIERLNRLKDIVSLFFLA